MPSITPRLLGSVLITLVVAGRVGADVPPAVPPPSVLVPGFPFADIKTTEDLQARLICPWLAGMPGQRAYNGRNVHAGVDLRATLGEPFVAILPGVVDPRSDELHSGYGPGWTEGRVMLIWSELPDGGPLLLVYGHTQNHKVHGGDFVRAGQELGEIGPWLESEGGPHLHVTMRLGDLPRWGWGTPTLAGNKAREGAEVVATEEDVLKLGYRNPLASLWGITPQVCISLP